MERYASSLKMKEIKRLAGEKQYLKAMKILETLNVDKIRSMSDLSVIAEVLISNEDYEDAMEILLRIYEKSCTRRILEQLIDVSIKMKNMEETQEYYNEYIRIAPRDPYRFVLRYHIQKASHVPYAQRIDTLEQLKKEDYMEEWGYELAKLYHKTGQVDKCVEECSDLILWFGQGIIVDKARLLKEHYTSGFSITDNLAPGEFDATRSLEEVIRQVKQRRGNNPVPVENENPSPVDIDRTVTDNMQYDNDALYRKSEQAARSGEEVEYHSIDEKTYVAQTEEMENPLWNTDPTDAVEEQDESINHMQYEEKQAYEDNMEYDEKQVYSEGNAIPEEGQGYLEDKIESEEENQIYPEANEGGLTGEYLLTPDVIKQVKARVSELNNESKKVESIEKELVAAEKHMEQVQHGFVEYEKEQLEKAIDLQEESRDSLNKVMESTEYGEEQLVHVDQIPVEQKNPEDTYGKVEENPVARTEEELKEQTVPEIKKEREETVVPEINEELGETVVSDTKEELEEQTVPGINKELEEQTVPEIKNELEETVVPESNEEREETVVSDTSEELAEKQLLTNEELQRMKEKMQQLQTTDVIQTYRHDTQDIVQDGDTTYAYGVNLNTIFQNYIENDSLKNQILSILENMEPRKECNNFMICGEEKTGKTSLARAIAITMWKLNRIPTKKVAKIKAEKLNQINLIEKMEPLADGTLVIEEAGKMEGKTVAAVLQMIEIYQDHILVILEDETRQMENLLGREERIREYMTHRIILPHYTAKDIVGFAYSMIHQQEYEVDPDAKEELEAKVERIYRITPYKEILDKVKEYTAEVIKRAETKNMLLLMKQAKEGNFTQNVTNIIKKEDIID
ncbi:ATP-binding protein [Anaerosporobacter faecicola]|uniref:ATP-binding protein n=1 Tax=Anaerosporobacter faecicola TaxID=2718714 RepID=UPI001438BB1B|nr:ATP-binding protein [Anaerosporobacter faecicola]